MSGDLPIDKWRAAAPRTEEDLEGFLDDHLPCGCYYMAIFHGRSPQHPHTYDGVARVWDFGRGRALTPDEMK